MAQSVPGSQPLPLRVVTSRWASRAVLPGLVILALLINAWGLSKNGFGNTYYAAAARSMPDSWNNFFFGAFDPGGFITIDKPPVFLWIQAASVWLFGYSSWPLLLPSAIAGTAAVALLWLIVRRHFGVPAATIAALVLLFTPISVVVNRLNLPETFYVLALVGAAGCTLRSLESPRWWTWTAAAGLLVGVAFNTKMLAAWIPGPALALAIVVGVEGAWRLAWRQWLPRLAVLGAVTLVVSASWMLVVDAWSASDRPYVGGSTDNSVRDLILGYNGFKRVEGNSGASTGGAAILIPRGPGANPADQGGPGAGAGYAAPGKESGDPGVLRMFDDYDGGQIAWFLPFALIGGVICLWRWRDQRLLRAAAALWLGWVLLFGAVFSYTHGIYHSYYTAAMAPGVAALAGMSVVALDQLTSRQRGWLVAAVAMALVTLAVQIVVSGRADGFFDWVRPLMVVAVLVGLALLAAAWQRRLPVLAGLAVVVGGLLLLPAAWSAYETTHTTFNTALAQAGPRVDNDRRSAGSEIINRDVVQLAYWLKLHDENVSIRWDVAVLSALNGATLIAVYDLSVMALGGFSGRDPTLTAAEFAELVRSGEVRYVLTNPLGGLGLNLSGGYVGLAPATPQVAGASVVFAAVREACEPILDPVIPVQYRGLLYDCAGRAEQLGAQ